MKDPTISKCVILCRKLQSVHFFFMTIYTVGVVILLCQGQTSGSESGLHNAAFCCWCRLPHLYEANEKITERKMFLPETPLPLSNPLLIFRAFHPIFPSALAVLSPTRCSFDHSHLLCFRLLCFHPLLCFLERLQRSSTSRSPCHLLLPHDGSWKLHQLQRCLVCMCVSTVVRRIWPPGSPGWHLKCTHMECSHGSDWQPLINAWGETLTSDTAEESLPRQRRAKKYSSFTPRRNCRERRVTKCMSAKTDQVISKRPPGGRLQHISQRAICFPYCAVILVGPESVKTMTANKQK